MQHIFCSFKPMGSLPVQCWETADTFIFYALLMMYLIIKGHINKSKVVYCFVLFFNYVLTTFKWKTSKAKTKGISKSCLGKRDLKTNAFEVVPYAFKTSTQDNQVDLSELRPDLSTYIPRMMRFKKNKKKNTGPSQHSSFTT